MKDIDVNVFLCKYAQEHEVIRIKLAANSTRLKTFRIIVLVIVSFMN